MLLQLWHIEMLGDLRAHCGAQTLTRFKSQKVATLLAYLAFYPSRSHGRDELQTLLWPDDEPDAVRNRLRVSLSSLRHQLEPPGTPPGAVLVADRTSIGLRPEAFTTDTARFDAAIAAALRAETDTARLQSLKTAVEAYGGELLPGLYDEWVVSERARLAQSYLQALRRLARQLAQAGDYEQALSYARLATQHDRLREESHRDVIRLYIALGQPSAALQQYEELKQHLQATLGVAPAPSTQQLAQQIASALGHSIPPANTQAVLPTAIPAPSIPAVTIAKSVEETKAGANGECEGGQLPIYLTRYFGREQEQEALCALLAPVAATVPSARLVTLTGMGGNGKTRLAVTVAQRLRPHFAGNVWFVPLADLSDARLIADTIINVLGLPHMPRQEPISRISVALADKPTLIVLDNFEQLAVEGAPLVWQLIEHVPTLSCLVTSRRILGLTGEHEFTIDPLPVPTTTSSLLNSPSALLVCPSVQLFLDRAQVARPDFQITERNAAEIAALCRELEGIPLALELTAARARVLTPAQMRNHLNRRFDLLVNQRADKDARHRSLRAAIAWSYRLLPVPLRRLYAQLSVFAGGWSLAAAQAICRENGNAAPTDASDTWLLDDLEQLRNDSLIVGYEVGNEMRFRMLETLREFAAEQMASDERDALLMRYVRYFVMLAEQAWPHLKGAQQALWLDRLQVELDNLRAASELCLKSPDGAEMGLRLTRDLERFWISRGLMREGRERSLKALAHPEAQSLTPLRASALISAGALAANQDDYAAARALHLEALETAKQAGSTIGEAWALDNLGTIELRQGTVTTARELFEQSLSLHREIGDERGVAATLSHLGSVALSLQDYDTAQSLLEQSLQLHKTLGDLLHIAATLGNLGMIANAKGNDQAARALHEECLAINHELNNQMGIAAALTNLGIIEVKLHNDAAAHERFSAALSVCREIGLKRGAALILGNLGSLEEQRGNAVGASELYDQSLSIQREIGDRRAAALTLSHLGRVYVTLGAYAQARACLDECLQICRETGDQACAAAGLEGLTALAAAQGELDRPAR